jgi:hypothetical protein
MDIETVSKDKVNLQVELQVEDNEINEVIRKQEHDIDLQEHDINSQQELNEKLNEKHIENLYKNRWCSCMCNPFTCCCDYLPHKTLNFSKVDIPENVICMSGENSLSRDFNEHVIRNILLPYYDTRIKYIMNRQICWSRTGNIAYTTSSILVGIASVLSFASGSYPNIHLNFIAGSLGLMALICKEFGTYSNTLDHAMVSTVNKLLNQLKIAHELSDTSIDVSTLFNSTIKFNKI